MENKIGLNTTYNLSKIVFHRDSKIRNSRLSFSMFEIKHYRIFSIVTNNEIGPKIFLNGTAETLIVKFKQNQHM